MNGEIKYYISDKEIKDFINVSLTSNFSPYRRIDGYNIYINNNYTS